MRASPLWKLVFTVLALLPFLPAISVYAVAALAKIKGCSVGEKEICVAGAISVSRTIVEMAQANPGLAVVLLVALTWLALCYLCVGLGWKGTASRLLVGLAVTSIFGGLPYFASLPSLGNFVAPDCKPHGGVGVCGLFEGSIGGGVHILLIQVWVSFIGLPFGLLAFLVFALVILQARTRVSATAARRPLAKWPGSGSAVRDRSKPDRVAVERHPTLCENSRAQTSQKR